METRSATVTATATLTESNNVENLDGSKSKILVLKLKDQKTTQNIRWSEDVVDNEKQGKKSSKRCCIFHKKKSFAESDSDESDSDTEVAKRQEVSDPKRPKNFQRFHA